MIGFEHTGKENTDATVKAALEAAEKYGIDKIVVASTKGETAKKLIDRAFEYADSITFAFQGGEPTLCGHEFFEKFTAYVKEKQKEKKAAVRYVLQTNGLLTDEHFADIFKENDFLIGLSLDGAKDCHDINRVDSKRNGTFSITTLRTVVSSVAKSLFSAKTSLLASRFINVLFPTLVYPTREILTILPLLPL